MQVPELPEVPEAALVAAPTIGRAHARRLRDVYRSAGWPCQDLIEVELLAAGLLQQVHDLQGRTSMRVTPPGLALMATTLARNRAALSAHQALEDQVARSMQRAGRIVWRGLALRAQVPCGPPALPAAPSAALAAMLAAGSGFEGIEQAMEDTDAPAPSRWCIAKPDVFSIRNTSVEAYLAPVVHEIKVRRSDLLSDLRNPAKRAAYLDVSSECWYVLGRDGKGRPIGEPDEIPATCGVMLAEGPAESPRLVVARPAPRRARVLPFGIWLALAKATPLRVLNDDDQQLLSSCGSEGDDDPDPTL